MSISPKQKEIFQKGKCHWTLHWKSFQKSNKNFSCHMHFKYNKNIWFLFWLFIFLLRVLCLAFFLWLCFYFHRWFNLLRTWNEFELVWSFHNFFTCFACYFWPNFQLIGHTLAVNLFTIFSINVVWSSHLCVLCLLAFNFCACAFVFFFILFSLEYIFFFHCC